MASKFGSNIVDALKWVIKALVSTRYAYDTFTVALTISGPVIAALDVLVIDAFLLTMWVVASYQGKREDIVKMRLPSAIAAWVMFAAMLYIAGSIGEGVTLVARVTGALALAWDTYAIFQAGLADWAQRRRDAAAERDRLARIETLDQRRHRSREAAWKSAYTLVVRTAGLVMIAWRSLGRVADDVAADEELMDHKVAQERAIRRGQAGMAAAPLALGVDPSEMVSTWQDPSGAWMWSCRACGQSSSHGFKGEGNARGAWRQHIRLAIRGHEVFTTPTPVPASGSGGLEPEAINESMHPMQTESTPDNGVLSKEPGK